MTPSLDVTTVTENATRDELTDREYAEIFSELRANRSLDAFCAAIGSGYSKPWWSKYERGEVKLTRAARNELRRAVGLRPLPPTVAEAIGMVDPDATVYRIGKDTPRRVLLIGVKGAVTVRSDESGVTAAHSDPGAPRRRQENYRAISAPKPIVDRLDALRRAEGLSWGDLLSRLVDSDPANASSLAGHPESFVTGVTGAVRGATANGA